MAEIKFNCGLVTLFDDADSAIVGGLRWFVERRDHLNYARARIRMDAGWGKIFMHRLIMNAPRNMTVDHINGNALDNRRANLRICTMSENLCNKFKRRGSSKYKGVHWARGANAWRAMISVGSKTHALGTFANEGDAARAYDSAARRLYGDFANLNFPATVTAA